MAERCLSLGLSGCSHAMHPSRCVCQGWLGSWAVVRRSSCCLCRTQLGRSWALLGFSHGMCLARLGGCLHCMLSGDYLRLPCQGRSHLFRRHPPGSSGELFACQRGLKQGLLWLTAGPQICSSLKCIRDLLGFWLLLGQDSIKQLEWPPTPKGASISTAESV